MKKLYYFLVNSGRVIFIWALLFITSISLYSLTIKGKVNYGGRCYQNLDDAFIKEYEYKGIEIKDGYLECNTYYLSYKCNLAEKDNLLFLVSLSKLLADNDVDINLHVIISCDDYQMLSTIVDYNVSYIKSIV